ncbi:MAG TPA: serine hydrolase domain-containing protein [Acidimicrobiales bacterium]|jgi:CubicO group peptidase (beta-lactamase class C family)
MSVLSVDVDPREWGFSPDRLARIGSYFDRYVNDRRLAGWQVTLRRGTQLIYSATGGHRDRERALSVRDDTIWRIYSMTKPVIAVATMMLYEEGLFDLNSEVGRWIEELREPRVWSGGTPDHPETVGATDAVRVHHLLTHMSGLTYGFQYNHPVDQIYRNKGYDFLFKPGANLEEAVHDWCSSPLVFQPGSKWNYSVAFDVLGRLIEIWSGQSLDLFLQERIFDPLGMPDTGWWVDSERAERLAMLYFPSAQGSTPQEDWASYSLRRPPILGGGGGLHSTAADYDRFCAMMLGGGELDGVRLLSSRTVDLMTSNHLPGDVDLEEVAVDSYSEIEYRGLGFGFGMSVMNDRRRNKSLVSEGSYSWGGAASTTFWIDPAEDLTASFYTQLLPSGTYPIRRRLQTLVYQALAD